MKRIKTALITTIMIVVAASVQAESKHLTGPEINDLYTGSTFEYWGRTKGISSYTQKEFAVNDQTNGPITGKWWINGNRHCLIFSNGFQLCDEVKKEGDGIYSTRGYKFKIKSKRPKAKSYDL